MMYRHNEGRSSALGRGVRAGALVLAAGVAVTACDLGVSTPTLIEDADLNDVRAIPAIAAGVAGDYAYAMIQPGGGGLITAGAMLSDELVHVGTWVGLRGPSDGDSRDDWIESQSRWAEPSKARWTAENAIGRITSILQEAGEDPQGNKFVAQVTHWAGHANRVMGDHFCNAVIDGGPLESQTVYYTRAEEFFTDAIGLTAASNQDDYRLSAIAGRAHARMMLGDWQGAVADAQQVPTGFAFLELHKDSGREENMMYWWGFRRNETSVWGTPFAEWGVNVADEASTGDPRVKYDIAWNNKADKGVLGGDGRRPFYRQHKYLSYDEDIAVVKGTEMRLIEAEAALVNNEVVTAVAKINEVRAFHELPPVAAATVADGWALLQKERGIELWLEGKRLADLRRWADTPGFVTTTVVREEVAGEPASADPRLNVLNTRVMAERGDMCFLVSKQERDSNPNF